MDDETKKRRMAILAQLRKNNERYGATPRTAADFGYAGDVPKSEPTINWSMELGNMLMGHSRGAYPIPDRNMYQDILRPLFDALSADSYGIHFDNAVFEMHPYCWCDKDECPQCSLGTQFNWVFKPTGFQLSWYKYALRDSYTNQVVNPTMFKDMVDTCIASLTHDSVKTTTSLRDLLPIDVVRDLELHSTYGAFCRNKVTGWFDGCRAMTRKTDTDASLTIEAEKKDGKVQVVNVIKGRDSS